MKVAKNLSPPRRESKPRTAKSMPSNQENHAVALLARCVFAVMTAIASSTECADVAHSGEQTFLPRSVSRVQLAHSPVPQLTHTATAWRSVWLRQIMTLPR